MTLTKKLLSLAALVALVGISACKDDEDTNQLSKDEAKGKIASFNTTAAADISGVADADGVKAVQDFFNLVDADDPFGRIGTDKKKIRAFFHDKGREFKSIFTKNGVNGRTANEEPFDFASNTGIYEWNPALGDFGEFEKIEASNIIIILFPTEGSSTNNAQLKLTAYSEVEFYDDELQEYSYEPSVLNASISVDDVEVASLDLEVNWTSDGFPLGASITLEVAPYTASISFDDSGSTSSSLSVSFLKNQEVLVATTVTAKYSSTSKSESDLLALEGFVQFRELKFDGKIDVEATDAANPDWNEVLDVALYSDGAKLGDVIFVEENDEAILYLQYADGTKEKLETVLQPVIDEIDQLTEDLDNG